MDLGYALTPFLTWLIAGSIKFAINFLKDRENAFKRIGYGGMPSNHSAIVISMVTLIGLKEGLAHPAFGVAITLSFIVLLDAANLRREIGQHARVLNKHIESTGIEKKLREKIGHSKLEIVGGIIVGIVVAILVSRFSMIVHLRP